MTHELFLKGLSGLKVYTIGIYVPLVAALLIKILQLLASEPRQTPQNISNILDTPISSVKSALQYHYEMGHVKRVSHGLYEITELGKYVLQENIGR